MILSAQQCYACIWGEETSYLAYFVEEDGEGNDRHQAICVKVSWSEERLLSTQWVDSALPYEKAQYNKALDC